MVRSTPITIAAKKAPSFISIAADVTDGEIPLVVQVTGFLTDRQGRGLAGKAINLFVNSLTAASTVTASNGAYGFSLTFDEPGTYIVETEFPGDARYLGCEEEAGVRVGAAPNLLPLVLLAGVALASLLWLKE